MEESRPATARPRVNQRESAQGERRAPETEGGRTRDESGRRALDEVGQRTVEAGGRRPLAPATPPPARVAKTTARQALRRALASRQALRQAIILADVLGPPKALRQSEDD